ncbi:MAG: NnrS family protein [Hyphomicrobiaceae bacterium]
MSSSAARLRAYTGPALVSFGFRPFFLFGAVWAALAVAIFVLAFEGYIELPSVFAPVIWHQHEMIFGYVPAIIAGFLLTAVPNWTGRLPIVGPGLGILFAVWIAGRLAVFCSIFIGPWIAAAIDLAFLALLAAVIGREVVAARDARNMKVLVIVGLLFMANLTFHYEAIVGSWQGMSSRLGISLEILLICLIGGRIVPSFTRNWLAKRNSTILPVPFGRLDGTVMVITAAALAIWTFRPEDHLTILAAAIAAAANTLRLSRWAGHRTGDEPLVLVLHVAFAFVPLGFALVALAGLAPGLLLPSGAIHAWTAGAIGMMTLAVMTRASLGHTGRPLTATPQITFVYIAVFASAVARIALAFGILQEVMIAISAIAWVLGFVGFAAIYAPLLLRR